MEGNGNDNGNGEPGWVDLVVLVSSLSHDSDQINNN